MLQETEEYPINVKELFVAANVELSKKSKFTTFANAGKLYTEMDMCSMFIAGAHWLAEKLNLKKINNECRRNCVVSNGSR